jgi:electron transfer flavoprotein alpha/beta subunit
MRSHWANPEKTAVIVTRNGISGYYDAGPEYIAAVNYGPEPMSVAQCTRLQGRLALGPERCAIIDAIAADPSTPWAMAEAIRSAVTWSRNDQQIDELVWLLGLSDQDVDNLFALATTL